MQQTRKESDRNLARKKQEILKMYLNSNVSVWTLHVLFELDYETVWQWCNADKRQQEYMHLMR